MNTKPITEDDCFHTKDVVCPWCGYVHQESYEFPGDGEDECEDCGKRFRYSRTVSVTYTTKRVETP